MNIEDLLELLTPEQLEELARRKRSESNEPSKKRKQQRHKTEPKVSSGGPVPISKPKPRTGRQQKKSTLDKVLGDKGSPARRLGPPELGKRPNRFADGDLSDVKDTDQHLIKEDKQLWLDRKPTRRTTRPANYFTATCSRCDTIYDEVPASDCYKDEGGYVFICEPCMKNIGG